MFLATSKSTATLFSIPSYSEMISVFAVIEPFCIASSISFAIPKGVASSLLSKEVSAFDAALMQYASGAIFA